MKKRPSTSWGMPLFLLSAAFAACLAFLHTNLSFAADELLVTTHLPRVGIGVSLLCILAGHFSYPRVHNLKIFMLGYGTGLTGLVFFLGVQGAFEGVWVIADKGFIRLLYLLVFFNGLLACVLPSHLKYRWTKRLTLSVVLLESVFLYTWGYQLDLPAWLSVLKGQQTIIPWVIGGAVFSIAMAICIIFMKRSFYLGGILSGYALFFTVGWYGNIILDTTAYWNVLVFLTAPVFLLVGVLAHWLLRAEHRGDYDPLLQVYNRSYCDRIITERTKVNTSPPFCVAMVDIDHFKKVNDTYGHQAGDKVLFNTAHTISQTVSSKGILCRYGGGRDYHLLRKKIPKGSCRHNGSGPQESENLGSDSGKEKNKSNRIQRSGSAGRAVTRD